MSNHVELTPLLTRDEPVTWLFAGDSITQGAVHTRGWRDYTQLFKERLGEMGRSEDLVLNTAVGGWSTATLEPRLGERVLRHRPDAVFLMFGTNDSAQGIDGLDAFAERYRHLLERIRAGGIEYLVVQTTIPMMPVDAEKTNAMTDWPDEELRQRKLHGLRQRLLCLEDYAARTREVAAACGVPLVDHWQPWLDTAGRRAQLLDGGFHPNEYGHRLIAQTLFRACGMWDDTSWMCRLFIPVDLPAE